MYSFQFYTRCVCLFWIICWNSWKCKFCFRAWYTRF